MDYRQFRVTILDRTTVRIVKPGGISVIPDPKVPMDQLRERTIKILSRYLAAGSVRSPDELVVLGSHLFNGLFDHTTSMLFKDELDDVKRKPDTVLRLILEFMPDARELAELPWEYLYYPDDVHDQGKGFFIAAEPESRLILARHVPLLIKGLSAAPERLRILIVVSQPERYPEGEEALGEIVAHTVINAITELKDKSAGAIDTDELRQPTKRSLKEKIETYKPHVVHFLCHGKYEEAAGGYLGFVSEEDHKTLEWVSDEELPDCFLPEPRLIFLHACEGAHSDSYEAFRGAALQLVYSRVPAVVAMQYQVKNKVANLFALKFYESLGQGKPVDEAVQDGRRELRMFLKDKTFSSQAFGSPVVFLQCADEIVKLPDVSHEERREQRSLAPSAIRCTTCNMMFVSAKGHCSNCGARYTACEFCGEWTDVSKRYCGNCGEQRQSVAGRIEPEPRESGPGQMAVSGYAARAGGPTGDLPRRMGGAPGRERVPATDQFKDLNPDGN